MADRWRLAVAVAREAAHQGLFFLQQQIAAQQRPGSCPVPDLALADCPDLRCDCPGCPACPVPQLTCPDCPSLDGTVYLGATSCGVALLAVAAGAFAIGYVVGRNGDELRQPRTRPQQPDQGHGQRRRGRGLLE